MIGLAFLISPVLASADTLSDLQSLFQSLRAVLSALQVHIAATSQTGAAAATTESATHDIKILTLLLTFSNTSPNVGFEQGTRDVLFGSGQSVKSLVEKASYGTSHVSGAVEGWYQVPFALTTTEHCPYQDWLNSADTIAGSHGIDLNQYTHIAYVFSVRGDETTAAAWANCPASGWALYEVDKPYKRVVAAAPSIIPHEVLHQLGQGKATLGHANGLDCGVQSITANYLSLCRHQEYGDPFDVLGTGENVAVLGVSGALFNLPHRIEAGWLAPSRTPEITTDGTYTINQIDALAGIVGLKIKKPDAEPTLPYTSNDYYYVEYLPTQYQYMPSKYVTGVTLRIWPGTPFSPLLMDMTPRSCYPPGDPTNPNSCILSDWHDGFLGDGKTFTDNNGIQITQISHTATSATVKVDFSHRPILVSDKQAYQGGDTISASWSNLDTTYSNDWVGLVMNGWKWTDYTGSRAKMWFYTDGTKSGTKTVVVPNLSNGPDGQPRYWQLAYFPRDGYDELVRSAPIAVSYAKPLITIDRASYVAGSPIQVSWKNFSDVAAKDWIGVVMENRAWKDYTASRATMWFYTGGTSSGTKTFHAPAIPGRYQIAYFPNDGQDITYRSASFDVTALPPPTITTSATEYPQNGLKIQATWTNNSGAAADDWIGILAAGTIWKAGSATPNNWVWATTNSQTQGTTGGQTQGAASFSSTIPPGAYQLVYMSIQNGTNIEKARSVAFTITPQQTIVGPVVSAPVSVAAGEQFSAHWDFGTGSGMSTDWITIVPTGNRTDYGPWFSVPQTTTGDGILTAPGVPGTYDIVLYGDGAFHEITNTSITIGPPLSGTTLVPRRALVRPQDGFEMGIYWKTDVTNPKGKDWVALIPTGQAKWTENNQWFWTDGQSSGMKTVTVPGIIGASYDLIYYENPTGQQGAWTERIRKIGYVKVGQ